MLVGFIMKGTRHKRIKTIDSFVYNLCLFSIRPVVFILLMCTILTHIEYDGYNLHKTQINPNNSVADRYSFCCALLSFGCGVCARCCFFYSIAVVFLSINKIFILAKYVCNVCSMFGCTSSISSIYIYIKCWCTWEITFTIIICVSFFAIKQCAASWYMHIVAMLCHCSYKK